MRVGVGLRGGAYTLTLTTLIVGNMEDSHKYVVQRCALEITASRPYSAVSAPAVWSQVEQEPEARIQNVPVHARGLLHGRVPARALERA